MERKYQVASAVRRALVMGALTTAGVRHLRLRRKTSVRSSSRVRAFEAANLESTTPVTQVTAADVVTQGVTRIEDLVNQLPQAFAAQNVTVANGATGTATLNLRGLGSPRTLVLVDGRRMPYGGVTNSAADINQIPTQMIERVEVLTGGASAVYGSDAVAGVVNFIMKKDFEGVEVTSQYNFYWHENDFSGPGRPCGPGEVTNVNNCGKLRDVIAARAATNPAEFALPDDSVTDGEGKELSLMIGVNSGDGRGNITAYATVFDSDAVLQADRDYSACSLDTLGPPTGQFYCGGSSTSAGGRFTDFSTYNLTVDTATNMRNFVSAQDQYNFGPLNHYQRPERRYGLGAIGSLRVRRARRRVYPAVIQRLRVDRADRAQRQLLRDQHDQLRQSAAARGHPGHHRLRRGCHRGRYVGPDVHRPSQRRRRRTAAVVLERGVPRRGRRAWRDQRGLGLRRVGPVLAAVAETRQRSTTTSHRAWRVRSTCTTSAASRPASRSSMART